VYWTESQFEGTGWGVFAYCHAMSMSRVGTKKEVGAEAIRSRNLGPRVSDAKLSPPCSRHTHGIWQHNGAVKFHLLYFQKTLVGSSQVHASFP